MKTASAALKAHLAGELATIATCWRIARTDGIEFFFTDHDTDIDFEGDTYEAASGMLASALSSDRSLAADNMEAGGFLDSEKITEADLRARKFDLATVDIFLVNYEDLTMGALYLAKDWTLGTVEIRANAFVAALNGLAARLNRSIIELYSRQCRAELGDTRCGIDLLTSGTGWTQDGVVAAVTDNQTFTATGFVTLSGDEDCFRGGVLTWTSSGANEGLSIGVKTCSGVTTMSVVLIEPMFDDVLPGDTFDITVGCDKSKETCYERFANILRFRGEPFIPSGSTLPVTAPRKVVGGRNVWTRPGRGRS